MNHQYDHIIEAQRFIQSQITTNARCGIILGTGLGKLVEHIDIKKEIPYESIPHFPLSTVESHAGKLIVGMIGKKEVIALQGRFHFYEGYSMQQIVFPVRVLKFLGVTTLLVSNAAGGINPLFAPGSIMAITDHINLLGTNPLIGHNDERIGIRFPDMSAPYSTRLLDLATHIALENKIGLVKGVYASMSGPCLETRAEYRMLKIVGADAIGMSTVPEVIAAVHARMEVLGLSVITDSCLPDALEPCDIGKIIAVASKAEPHLVTLMAGVLNQV